MNNFLYLVNCKRELPLNLCNNLNNNSNNIVSLTWQLPTQQSIFFPFSRPVDSRNRLYQEIFKRKLDRSYLYYIFLDEDVHLKTTKFCKSPTENPWRIFEKYLLEYQPAVGIPDHLSIPKTTEIEGIYAFDVAVMAVHKEALHIALPFYESYKYGWQDYSEYFYNLVSLLYHSYALQFNAIGVVNNEHQVYPKKNNRARIEKEFENFIIDGELKKIFHLCTSNVFYPNRFEVRKKDKCYSYTLEDLSKLFDLNCQFWNLRLGVINNINKEKACAVFLKNLKIAYFSEYTNRKLGPKITMTLLLPFLIINEIWKYYVIVIGSLSINALFFPLLIIRNQLKNYILALLNKPQR